MDKTKLLAKLTEPNGIDALLSEADAVFEHVFELFLSGDEAARSAAAAFLCRAAKKAKYKAQLQRLFEHREPLYAALASGNAKLRKNAARLIGALEQERDAPALIQALKSETRRFVIPSILLALGSAGGDEALLALREYEIAEPSDETEQKHSREALAAKNIALDKLSPPAKHEFTGFEGPVAAELRAPRNLVSALVKELKALKIEPHGIGSDRLSVSTSDPGLLFKARSFYELLFPVASNLPADPEAAAGATVPAMERFFTQYHSGAGPYKYRLELRGEFDRAAFARDYVAAASSKLLINSPSAYELELRFEARGENRMDTYIKLYTLHDKRFDYRLHALPASIHPATAAALLRYALPGVKPGARVMDPCCGSGTMLIERAMLAPCSAISGIDISARAIEAARANAAAAGVRSKFSNKDYLRFTADILYDEVISNLPFGNRVGSHSDNKMLYSGILDMLPKWLRKGGKAVLYTMEYNLLKRLISRRPGLKLILQAKTEAGGLEPHVFVLEVL